MLAVDRSLRSLPLSSSPCPVSFLPCRQAVGQEKREAAGGRKRGQRSCMSSFLPFTLSRPGACLFPLPPGRRREGEKGRKKKDAAFPSNGQSLPLLSPFPSATQRLDTEKERKRAVGKGREEREGLTLGLVTCHSL